MPVLVVAFGSSSTEGAGASAPERTYPARLQAMLRIVLPLTHVTVLNRGKGGQVTQDMIARLDADVLTENPTMVIWQSGTNEALRGLGPGAFAAIMQDGIRKLIARGIDVVLMDLQIAPRVQEQPNHTVYGDLLARAAASGEVSLFSRTAVMRDWLASELSGEPSGEPYGEPSGAPMIGHDRLHHTDRGYQCLAEAVSRAIAGALRPETAIMAKAGTAMAPERARADGTAP